MTPMFTLLADALLFGYTAGEILIALVVVVIVVMAARWLFNR